MSTTAAPAATGGTGHFVPWNGGCLLIGRHAGVIPMHAHYAIQIAIGEVPGVRFRTEDDGEWTEYGGAMIPSRQPHSMDASALPSGAIVFVEPETREGRAITELYLRDGIAEIPGAVVNAVRDPLFSAWRERRDRRAMIEAAKAVIVAITGGVQPMETADERILRAIGYINSHLTAPLTLEEVAAEACLSPSRFRHLFVEETGMALRPYILWRRFMHVWELAGSGTSLSTAAHAAGFADAAHLSRTSRRMFGIPPSALRFDGPLRAGDLPSAISAPTFK